MLRLLTMFFVLITSTNILCQTIWDGPPMTFIKEDYANWALPENQDRITDDIIITRGDEMPIFNAAEQILAVSSPLYTQWAYGKIADGVETLDFDDWAETVDWTPPYMVGEDMVLYLTIEGIYIDIRFNSWTRGEYGAGGGFSYTRSTGEVTDKYWTGASITFTKEDSVDWTLPENQDRITENVWLTRAHTQGIFNIAFETSFDYYTPDSYAVSSPYNTQWAFGTIADGVDNLYFNQWGIIVLIAEEGPSYLLDKPMVLYLVSDSIYIDIMFTSWTSGEAGGGGGFSYTRSTGSNSQTLWTGPPLTFTKEDYADWTLPQNQDRIIEDVWLTRADSQGIFNIVQESHFTKLTFDLPSKTMWALGSTDDGIENLEFNYFLAIADLEPPSLVGRDMVLYLVPHDTYLDIKFTSWTSGYDGGGGGFSYIRSTDTTSSFAHRLLSPEFISCWPNPAQSTIFFDIETQIRPVRIQMFDVQGRLVLARPLSPEGSVFIGDLHTGLYFFRIIDETKTYVGQVMIE